MASEAMGTEGDRLLLNSRFVCDGGGRFDAPTVLGDGAEPVGAWIPHGTALPPSLLAGTLAALAASRGRGEAARIAVGADGVQR